MKSLEFFDGNCRLGRPAIPEGRIFLTADELLAELEYFGIAEAVVTHQAALDGAVPLGNELVMKELEGHPNLHPCWALLPSYTDEMPPEPELVKQMLDQGVKMARLSPDKNWIEFKDWALGELFAALEGQPIPLMVDVDEICWDDIYQACTQHPGMNLIVTGHSGRPRNAFGVLAVCPNVYLDLTGFYHGQLMEQTCQKFGAERLIFGSLMPQRTPGCLINMLMRAEISEEDKQLIAGGNLRRLTGGK